MSKLEHVQNCLARMVLKAPRFSPSLQLPLFKQLHWLPVVYQIKLANVTYHTLSTQQPAHLVNLLHFSDISRTLSSFISKQLCVTKTNLNIRKRAFSVSVPAIWNRLPITIKSSETRNTFCKQTENTVFV